METELTLSLGGLPPLSARGCYQELTPVVQGLWRRTLNGILTYIGLEDVKYKTLITCKDKTVIATESFLPGNPLEVGCIQRIWQKVDLDKDNKSIKLKRPAVKGSVFVVNELGENEDIKELNEQEITFNNRDELMFVSYRPVLTMMVKDFKLHVDEWGMTGGWSLMMEEV